MYSKRSSKTNMWPNQLITISTIVIIISLLVYKTESRDLHKRTFAGLGCLGIYDKAKFARLDRVCEECYQLYRESDLHTSCRQDCFRNEVFGRCVDALLLSHEQKKLEEMVEDLYGKK